MLRVCGGNFHRINNESAALRAVYQSGRRSFSVDDSDRVWLGRALVGESGARASEYPSILWTLARRYLWSRYPGSFLTLTRAFCQPVNDRWMPGGDLFEKALKRGAASASDAAIARRQWLRSLQWNDLPIAVQRAVIAFQAGTLTEPRKTRENNSTNWGSWPGIETKHPRGVSVGSRNWFFRDLSARAVSIISAGAAHGAGLALLALLIGGAWWLSK